MLNNCKEVIDNDFCIGCGVCSISNPKSTPVFNDEGLLVPSEPPTKVLKIETAQICPFSDKSNNETTLAEEFFVDATFKDEVLGHYRQVKVAKVKDDNARINSSSGGILTSVNKQLLKMKIVDAVIAVGACEGDALFKYKTCDKPEELNQFAKSKYYPVEIGSVISEILDDGKTYAVVALPCVTKALRNLQMADPKLKLKFPFISTVICGHLKSKHYAEFLGWQAGIKPADLTAIDFRVKNPNASADKYSIQVTSKSDSKLIDHNTVKFNDWGLGFFKPKACDYCDDVFGELGDIAVGDAWLPAYTKDYLGNSLLLIRSKLAESIFEEYKKDYIFNDIDIGSAIESQGGGLRHKREGIVERLDTLDKQGQPYPNKRRHLHVKKAMNKIEIQKVKLRMVLRKESENAFKKAIKSGQINDFYKAVGPLVKVYYSITVPLWKRTIKKLMRR